MKDSDNAHARTEALEATKAHRTSSASRNSFWAGLNRYLDSELQHEHQAAKREQEETTRQARGPSRAKE